MEKEVKIDIDNGTSFYADEIGLTHNPLKLIMDFRSITPRIDVRNEEFQPMVLRHNVVVLDIFVAKSLLEILERNIKDYEKRFGKIEKPAALRKLEKERNEDKKGNRKKNEGPSYFG